MKESSFNIIIWLLSTFTLYLLIKLFFLIKDEIMSIFLFYLFIFAIIPSSTVSSFRLVSFLNFTYVFLFWILLLVFFNVLSKIKLYKKKIIYENKQKKVNVSLITFLSILLLILSFYLNFSLFGFRILVTFDVYEYRATFAKLNVSSFYGYFMLFSFYVIIPLVLVYSILYKKYFLSLIAIISALLLFSLNGEKTVIFIVLFLIFIQIIKAEKLRKWIFFNRLIIYFNIGIVFVALSSFINIWPIGLFYRTFFIPQELSYNYIEFISSNVPLYLRESILRNIFDSPYEKLISFLVTDSIDNNANTGLIGDAFANFNFIGLLVYPLLIAIVLKILSFVMREETNVINYSIIFSLVWGIINFSFFTWLLSGGVILYLLIFSIKNRVII